MVALAAFGSRRHRGEQKLKKQRGLWTLIPLFIFSISSVFSSSSSASTVVEPGIDVTFYNNFGYNASPPLPEVSGRPAVGTAVYTHVDQNFDQFPPFGLYEDFIVKYEGYITSPVTAAITFLPTADDGNQLFLDDVLIDNNWRDKGGGGNPTAPQQFTAGVPRKFTLWYYENGGGAWTKLHWNTGSGWQLVPAAAYTRTATAQPAMTTTTTLAPYLNSPQNLTVTSTNESKVYLSWDAPESSNANVERYAIFFSKDNFSSGWAISSTQTTAVVENLDPDTEYQFKVRADNDTIPVYSGWSNEVTGTTDAPPITYSLTNAVWERVNEGAELTLSAPNGSVFTEVLFASYGTPTGSNGLYRTSQCNSVTSIQEVSAAFIGKTSATISADNGVFGDPCGGTYKHLSVVLRYAPLPTTTTTTTTTSPPTTTTTTTEPPVATTTTTTTVPVQTTVLQQTEQPQTTTTTSTVPVTTTTLPPTIKPPLPSSTELSTIATAEKLAEVLTSSNLEEIEPDQAIALITNPVFTELESDKLEAVFENLPVDELTAEQETALVTSLSSAPSAVKETFEATVDVYGSGLDEYVPEGSAIDVGTRRSVIAVTTVLSTATAAAAAAPSPGGGGNSGGGGSSPRGGGEGNGGSSGGDANKAARREDEEEDEEAGGLEGPEDREKNTNTRNSIYKYQENGMKKFNVWGFIKKFMKETAALSFTFAGSAIMFVTLSGDTRRIAIIATVAAVTVHYISVMLANDEE